MRNFNTPIKRIDDVFIKLEYKNPAGSIKDRPAVYILFDAYKKGYKEIVEATSGNTGIALAYYGKYFGIKSTIFMPSSYSVERQKLMKLYGANLILVDGDMKKAIKEAEKYSLYNNVYRSNQFSNKMNEISHIQTTASEILGLGVKFDYFVAGVGSGGTIMGIAKRLKPYGIKIVAVESKNSAPIYNKLYNKNLTIKSHLIQGIGAGFIPDNIDLNYIDDVLLVDDEEIISFSKTFSNFGVIGGLSSSANFIASNQLKGKIITIAPDSIERYLSFV